MGRSALALAALMLVAGCGIPVMASINAALGARLGSVLAAVIVLCLAAALAAAAVLSLAGGRAGGPSFGALRTVPPWQYRGGSLFLLYIFSATFAVPRIGLGNAIFLVSLGQLITAAASDHFGRFGAPLAPLSARRALGLVLMARGVYLARRELPPPG